MGLLAIRMIKLEWLPRLALPHQVVTKLFFFINEHAQIVFTAGQVSWQVKLQRLAVRLGNFHGRSVGLGAA